jgi:hypothetical protein
MSISCRQVPVETTVAAFKPSQPLIRGRVPVGIIPIAVTNSQAISTDDGRDRADCVCGATASADAGIVRINGVNGVGPSYGAGGSVGKDLWGSGSDYNKDARTTTVGGFVNPGGKLSNGWAVGGQCSAGGHIYLSNARNASALLGKFHNVNVKLGWLTIRRRIVGRITERLLSPDKSVQELAWVCHRTIQTRRVTSSLKLCIRQ